MEEESVWESKQTFLISKTLEVTSILLGLLSAILSRRADGDLFLLLLTSRRDCLIPSIWFQVNT
jgi:hypothetical protein